MIVTLNLTNKLTLDVEGTYVPPTPDVWYLPNGDPGYPGTDSEFYIKDITIVEGNLIMLLDFLDGINDIWEHLTNLTIKKIENEID